jgi:hypothetical protein
MNEHATYFTYQLFGQMLCVIGPDVTVVMGFIYLASVVDSAEVAVAVSSLQFFIALGYVCGPSFSTIIYFNLFETKTGTLLTQAESKQNPDLLSSLRASFWFWAALGYTGEPMSGCILLICHQRSLCFPAVVLSVILLRNMGEAIKSKDASVDENECISEKTQASTVGADNVLSIKDGRRGSDECTSAKGALYQKGLNADAVRHDCRLGYLRYPGMLPPPLKRSGRETGAIHDDTL